MSKIFPSAVAQVMRGNTDELIEITGQACKLYKIKTETTGKLGDSKTRTYESPIDTFVQVHWTPEVRRLYSLGLYVEGAPLPILAYPKFADDPKVGDYYEFDYEFSVGTIKTRKFEVADRKLLGHDVEARTVLIIAPKRA